MSKYVKMNKSKLFYMMLRNMLIKIRIKKSAFKKIMYLHENLRSIN